MDTAFITAYARYGFATVSSTCNGFGSAASLHFRGGAGVGCVCVSQVCTSQVPQACQDQA